MTFKTKRKIAQLKRQERESISRLQNLEERESGQTEGTTTKRDISRKIFSLHKFRTIGNEKTDLLIEFSIVDLLMKHVLVISICYGKVDFFEFEILKVGVHLAYTVVTVVT